MQQEGWLKEMSDKDREVEAIKKSLAELKIDISDARREYQDLLEDLKNWLKNRQADCSVNGYCASCKSSVSGVAAEYLSSKTSDFG